MENIFLCFFWVSWKIEWKIGMPHEKVGCHMPNCRQAFTQLFKVLQMFSTIKLNGNVEKMIF